ncbi:TPA: hypothetical protein N0F65_001185 [Lagenidium giganteum]|uniref:glucan endo-1,3-beta-D-glucosidase n=1 Tax=Lagenidium giganteum TaxID=4803 RepID=A0AAV2Z3R5_9STRA|nr:TPA: hypothetical protein N0F65_001185 [Lagenidium giganteum]
MHAPPPPPPRELFPWTADLQQLIRPHHIDTKDDAPIPTNKWWGNLIAFDAGARGQSDAIFAQPYTYTVALRGANAAGAGLSVSYLHQYRVDGPQNDNGAVKYYFYPPAIRNLVLGCTEFDQPGAQLSLRLPAWDDVGVHVEIASTGGHGAMQTYLALGNAFPSVRYMALTPTLRSEHAITHVNGQPARHGVDFHDKDNAFQLALNNGQEWIVFVFPFAKDTPRPVFRIGAHGGLEAAAPFSGVVQVAFVPSDASHDAVVALYRQTAGRYLTGATTAWENDQRTFWFQWEAPSAVAEAKVAPQLLHFAFEHQRELLDPTHAIEKPELVLWSHTRGKMFAHVTQGQSGTCTWKLQIPEVESKLIDRCAVLSPPNAHVLSQDDLARTNLCEVLRQEIEGDWNCALPAEGSYYFKRKALQKYGTMCVVARDLAQSLRPDLQPLAELALNKFKDVMLKFVANKSKFGLVYDTVYKGIISSEALAKHDMNVDFGNAVYNDHHYHYGYVITAAAMLFTLDPAWMQSEAAVPVHRFVDVLLQDTLNYAAGSKNQHFPRFRNFDWFLGHSLSHGLTPMADGKDEESTSEEVNLLYGAYLYGKATNNTTLEGLAKLLLKLNARAIKTYFLISSTNVTHPECFRKNKVTGVFFDNKCDYATWFSPNKECIHGIQMLPVSPILDAVRTVDFIREEWHEILAKLDIIKNWQTHATSWTSLLYANASVLDSKLACQVLATCPMDDGLSRAWALYTACSRNAV